MVKLRGQKETWKSKTLRSSSCIRVVDKGESKVNQLFKHRILGMIIGSLLTFVTLDIIRKELPDALSLAILIGSLIATLVACVIGFLIVVAMIITGLAWLKRKLK